MRLLASCAAVGLSLALSVPVQAGAIHDASLFTSNTLAANDDSSTGRVALGFNINFFGSNYDSLFVNNNGNVTFTEALNTFTPFNIITTGMPMLAPFFADVDTRGFSSGVTKYGRATLDGFSVFGVNWINVGYYNSKTDKLNSFQLIITDRNDTGAGNFDFEFNYDSIQWETGSASEGVNGLGGKSARVGWSNGVDQAFELNGSALNGAFLDTNLLSGLKHNSLNSSVLGQYKFNVRNGAVVAVPEPASLGLLGLGIMGLALARRRKTA